MMRALAFRVRSGVALPGGDEGGDSGCCLLALLAGHRLGADPVQVDPTWPAAGLIAGAWHGCVRPAPAAELSPLEKSGSGAGF
jgi:hypothetical protein